jgi:hypothetical protein
MPKKYNRFEGVTSGDLIDYTSPIQVVEGRRLYTGLTSTGNQLVGAVDGWLVSHPGYHTPSAVGRGLRINSTVAWQILSHMDSHGIYVTGDGNGCWRKYSTAPAR